MIDTINFHRIPSIMVLRAAPHLPTLQGSHRATAPTQLLTGTTLAHSQVFKATRILWVPLLKAETPPAHPTVGTQAIRVVPPQTTHSQTPSPPWWESHHPRAVKMDSVGKLSPWRRDSMLRVSANGNIPAHRLRERTGSCNPICKVQTLQLHRLVFLLRVNPDRSSLLGLDFPQTIHRHRICKEASLRHLSSGRSGLEVHHFNKDQECTHLSSQECGVLTANMPSLLRPRIRWLMEG